jgi:hypothetical protein
VACVGCTEIAMWLISLPAGRLPEAAAESDSGLASMIHASADLSQWRKGLHWVAAVSGHGGGVYFVGS